MFEDDDDVFIIVDYKFVNNFEFDFLVDEYVKLIKIKYVYWFLGMGF